MDSIWDRFGARWRPPDKRMRPMGCVLGHHSSLFLRFRAINGVTNASREYSFDPSSQSLHQVTPW